MDTAHRRSGHVPAPTRLKITQHLDDLEENKEISGDGAKQRSRRVETPDSSLNRRRSGSRKRGLGVPAGKGE